MKRFALPTCRFFATRKFIEEKLDVVCAIQRAILDSLHNDSHLKSLLKIYSPDLTQKDYNEMCLQIKRCYPDYGSEIEKRLKLMHDVIEDPNLLREFRNH